MSGFFQRWLAGILVFGVLAALLLIVRVGLRGSGLEGDRDRSQAVAESPEGRLGTPSAISDPHLRFDRRFEHWEKEFMSYVTEPEFKWNSGATDEEIAKLEDWAGMSLPGDLRRLLKKHDGQELEATPIHFVDRLLSCAEIVAESEANQSANEDVGLAHGDVTGENPVEEAAWWHKDLMLFLSDDNGGGVAIDRRTGAIWNWDHDGGMFGMMAPDLSTFFEWMALAFEEGRIRSFGKGEPPAFYELDPDKVAAAAADAGGE